MILYHRTRSSLNCLKHAYNETALAPFNLAHLVDVRHSIDRQLSESANLRQHVYLNQT